MVKRKTVKSAGRKKTTGSQPGITGRPYRPGRDPEKDAWFTAFFIENHLDHFTHPDHAASPEQVRFMIYTEEEERYYPCSQRMFSAIMNRKKSPFLTKKYKQVLKRVLDLIDTKIEDEVERKYLAALIRIKWEHEIRDQIMIPSRLEKRLVMIFLNRTLIEDPYMYDKAVRNQRMQDALNSKAFFNAMNRVDKRFFSKLPQTLTSIREQADYLEFKRLVTLTGADLLWESEAAKKFTEKNYLDLFDKPVTGNGVDPLLTFLGIVADDRSNAEERNKSILWLADEAGQIIVDLAIINYLTKRGHKVILAMKAGPLFTKIDFPDIHSDTVLESTLKTTLLIQDRNLSKNDLLKKIKSDYDVIIISDGTREDLNLLLSSTTFARCFKEVDGVISRGIDQKRRFFDSPFFFTQDIFNISADGSENIEISFKPKHPAVIKFSYADLEKRARSLIDQMAEAKSKGMTVVFYSGIIGSIPGKIQMAKKIMAVFVDYLKQHAAMIFIINPSEFFESGMDADDLMYMWEIVQRSGRIDIWRFQTYGDIAEAFRIMGTRVPPEWVGKDATFSTGCTKEMKIALEVQKDHPEMQIIGPSHEKFMRRRDYGIGKMHDRRLGQVY